MTNTFYLFDKESLIESFQEDKRELARLYLTSIQNPTKIADESYDIDGTYWAGDILERPLEVTEFALNLIRIIKEDYSIEDAKEAIFRLTEGWRMVMNQLTGDQLISVGSFCYKNEFIKSIYEIDQELGFDWSSNTRPITKNLKELILNDPKIMSKEIDTLLKCCKSEHNFSSIIASSFAVLLEKESELSRVNQFSDEICENLEISSLNKIRNIYLNKELKCILQVKQAGNNSYSDIDFYKLLHDSAEVALMNRAIKSAPLQQDSIETDLNLEKASKSNKEKRFRLRL